MSDVQQRPIQFGLSVHQVGDARLSESIGCRDVDRMSTKTL
jgi:hypothetical protein